MRTFGCLKVAAAAMAVTLPMTAQAAVTYQFAFTEASDSIGGFTLTVAEPITADTIISAADLTSCYTGYADTSCGDHEFFYQPGRTRIGFATLQLFEGDYYGATSFAYFSLDAFTTNGVHDDIVWPGEATLTVSGIVPAPPAIPEPASWALTIGGLGVVGAALRRRPRMRFATN